MSVPVTRHRPCTPRVLPPTLDASRQARQWIDGVFESCGLVDHDGVAQLLVSEVVTNAITHGRGRPKVWVEHLPGRLRVCVRDSGSGWPTVTWVAPEATSGRGMAIVNTLASAWACERLPRGGKVVWFEMARPQSC